MEQKFVKFIQASILLTLLSTVVLTIFGNIFAGVKRLSSADFTGFIPILVALVLIGIFALAFGRRN